MRKSGVMTKEQGGRGKSIEKWKRKSKAMRKNKAMTKEQGARGRATQR